MYAFTQPLHHGQDVTQGQFLSRAKLIWIQSFPSHKLVAKLRLKNLARPTSCEKNK